MPEPQATPQPGQEPGSSTPTSTPNPAAGDPPATPANGTLAEQAGGAAPEGESITDWRTTLAGEDQEALQELSRFKSSNDFLKSFREAQTKIRSGAHKQGAEPPGEGATEEEIATWRKEAGIPEDPKGYLENLPDGLVFGEQDEAALGSFTEAMHSQNVPPDMVHKMLNWYQQFQEDGSAQIKEADKTNQAEAADRLREEWGTDYRSNLQSALNFMKATAPSMEDGNSVADALMNARMPNGVRVGDHPDALRWFANLAQEQNPAGFVAPGSGLTNEQSIENEITEIEKMMREAPRQYFADDAKQARLRTLYTARDKLSGAA